MKLQLLIERYITYRQAMGERFKSNAYILRAFGRAIGPRTCVARIRAKGVATFLAGQGPITNTWHRRYSTLKGFFQFAVSRGHLDKIPLPTKLPKPLPKLVPYIYSREEIQRLLDAIPSHPFLSRMESPTLRAILLLLYGAGLRRDEALNLLVTDVDLPNSLLTIRATKFFKSRLVPISRDLTKVLSDYARWRETTHPSADGGGHFFLGSNGEAVHRWTLQRDFTRLRKYAGVQRTDGGRFQPRMHDLRHTFAVHRLTAWYRQGKDVQRLVYQLSVYLGHACLADTQVYLSMTPELLQEAGTRFETYACGSECHD